MTIVMCCEQAREVAGDEGDVVGHDCVVHGPGSFLAARAALAESRAETAEARRQRENDAAKAAEIVREALKDRDAARTEVSRLTDELSRVTNEAADWHSRFKGAQAEYHRLTERLGRAERLLMRGFYGLPREDGEGALVNDTRAFLSALATACVRKCATPGPNKGSACRADTLGIPFTSDDWCGCPCHRAASAPAETPAAPVITKPGPKLGGCPRCAHLRAELPPGCTVECPACGTSSADSPPVAALPGAEPTKEGPSDGK